MSRANGKIIAAGSTGNSMLPVTPSTGLYLQEEINSPLTPPGTLFLDGIVMGFEPSTALSYCTYFGGLEGPNGERIHTTAFWGGVLYLAGFTTKPPLNPNAYFPLDDAGGWAAYFDDSYDPAPLNLHDGFLTAICMELYTDAPLVPAPSADGFRILPAASGEWLASGLPQGPHRLQLFDAKGALAHEATLVVGAPGAERLRLPGLAPGLYTCRAIGHGAAQWAKLLVEHR